MSLFFRKKCPVCGEKITNYNRSNAKFNNDYICKNCTYIINKCRGGEKSEDGIFLEDLQKMVRNFEKENLKKEYVEKKYGELATNVMMYDSLDSEMKANIELDDRYADVITEHYRLMEEIDMLYSTAINLPNINNDATKKCIELCTIDINLASTFKDYCIEHNKINKISDPLPLYSSFYYLTQLYDKLGDIDKAIEVCQLAVSMKYYRDNSKGGMPARLARLLKKKSKIIES